MEVTVRNRDSTGHHVSVSDCLHFVDIVLVYTVIKQTGGKEIYLSNRLEEKKYTYQTGWRKRNILIKQAGGKEIYLSNMLEEKKYTYQTG
jgi:hypothetical protein